MSRDVPAENRGEGSDVVGLRLLFMWLLGVDDVNRGSGRR